MDTEYKTFKAILCEEGMDCPSQPDSDTESWRSNLDVRPPHSRNLRWAITISPPLHHYSDRCKVDIIGDLYQFKHYILNGQLDVYPEFSAQGRLHYHTIFYPSEDNFANDYLFWVSKQGQNEFQFDIRIIKGYTKTGKPKTKKYKRCPSRRFQLKLKTANITDSWLIYCTKGSEFTQKILGFDKIDKDIYIDIENYIKKKYLINII